MHRWSRWSLFIFHGCLQLNETENWVAKPQQAAYCHLVIGTKIFLKIQIIIWIGLSPVVRSNWRDVSIFIRLFPVLRSNWTEHHRARAQLPGSDRPLSWYILALSHFHSFQVFNCASYSCLCGWMWVGSTRMYTWHRWITLATNISRYAGYLRCRTSQWWLIQAKIEEG